MKLKTLRLLSAWEGLEADTVLKVDEDTYKKLIEDGTAEKYDPDAEKKQQQRIVEVVKQELEEALKSAKPEGDPETDDDTKVSIKVGDPEIAKDPKRGFTSMSDFCHEVWKAGPRGTAASKRLKTVFSGTFSQEGDEDQGGYLVPEEFRATLLQKAFDYGEIMRRCRTIPMARAALRIPSLTENSRRAGYRLGGIRTYWTQEGEQKTESKPHFGYVRLELEKLTGLWYTSDELLEDSALSLEPFVVDLFSKAITWEIEEAIIRGNGAGMPLGILNAACLVTQAAEGAQAVDTIVAENVVNMWSRLFGPSMSSAVWLVGQDCLPQLHTMSLAIGAAGVPVYMPANGLSGTPYATLYGKPCIVSEHADTVGDVGDIILADFSQYLLGIKQNSPQVASSIHIKFDYDLTCFRFVMRVDGQPWWPSALTPMHSATTLSPFVMLAAR